MLEHLTRSLLIALIAAVLFTGCSQFTHAGRQQAAYARYVRKYSHNKVKQKTKFKKLKMPFTPESPSVVNAGSSDAPQSVSSGDN